MFSFFEVEYNGNSVPCCNIRSDIPDHKDYVVGKISSEHGVFDIYFNKIMTEWRRDLLPFSKKKAPCDICYDRLIPETPENISQFNEVSNKLGLIQLEKA
ncbi:SPASM domain-containing protein [Azospirillum sp.]|uniref:SPASM domain-containing protein n=1 Tax=Azospirillum sp. TaxID=34012 RepID=UPI00342324BC